MDESTTAPPLVDLTLRLEETTALDGAVGAVRPVVTAAFGSGWRGSLLRGEWLGHAVHPVLTDLALGSWISASLLDLVGGEGSARSAQTLVGAGVLVAVPTAWTGWAEWSAIPPRDQRVGLVHAVTNGGAIGVYAASWRARRRGRHGAGVALGLLGAALSAGGGYLGSHLAEVRHVASHNPAYDREPEAG